MLQVSTFFVDYILQIVEYGCGIHGDKKKLDCYDAVDLTLEVFSKEVINVIFFN